MIRLSEGNYLPKWILVALLWMAYLPTAQAQTLIATAMKKIIKSTDGGKTWTPVWDSSMDSKAGGDLTSITYGDGKIVATGDILIVSADGGKTWKEIPIVGDTKNNLLKKYYTSVAYGDGMFVLASAFRVLYSTDGMQWKYLAGGSQTTPKENSDSGEKKKSSGGLGKLKSIASNPSGAVSSTKETSSSSTSSSSNSSNQGMADPPGMRDATEMLKVPRAVNFVNGKFIITGGSQAMEMAIVVKDGNGLKLEKKFDLFGEFGNAATTNSGLGRIATDGKTLVVVTEGSTKSGYSLDGGATWKFIRNPSDKFTNSVAYGNGIFVAVNGFGEVIYTSDITQGWTGASKFYDLMRTANRVFFDGTKFIILCHDQEVFVSKDAKTWTYLTDKAVYGNHVYDVIKMN